MLAAILSVLAGVENGADGETSNLLWTILVILGIIALAVYIWSRTRRR
jgi:Mg2+ and Co2+ transporter CorA